MGTKNHPGRFDCYAAAAPDEPVFVLLGRDPHAAAIVEEWARLRSQAIDKGEKPEGDWAKVSEAMKCAAAMRAYHAKRQGNS